MRTILPEEYRINSCTTAWRRITALKPNRSYRTVARVLCSKVLRLSSRKPSFRAWERARDSNFAPTPWPRHSGITEKDAAFYDLMRWRANYGALIQSVEKPVARHNGKLR